MSVTSRPFGSICNRPVTLYSLHSKNGVSADIMNYGATLVSFRMRDPDGSTKNIVLGYERLEEYLTDQNFMGVIVGRFANRIANASFSINNQKYKLSVNDGPNQLHGGAGGFHRALWEGEPLGGTDGCGVKLSLKSPDLDQGYPGNLDVSIVYWLTEEGILSITMTATTDRPTFVNMASHAYFNLSDSKDITGHQLKIFASSHTPVDDDLIPTGEIVPVAGSPFNFQTEKIIGMDLASKHPQMVIAGGYDHNFVVDGSTGTLRPVAKLCDLASDRQLLVLSTQPGVQFYSGNNLSGAYRPRAGLCLETQHFPDSPNQTSFPSSLVLPQKPYQERVQFQVSNQGAT